MFEKLFYPWNKITSIGLRENYSTQKKRYVINTNAFAFIVVLITIPYPFVYTLFKVQTNFLMLAGAAIFVLFYSLVILSNHTGHHLTAKLIFAITGFIQLMSISLYFGKTSGLEFFFFPAVVLPFFIADRHESFLRNFAIFIMVSEYFLLQFIYPLFPPVVIFADDTQIKIKHITIFLVFLMLLLQSYHYYRSSQIAEKTIEDEQKKADELLLNILPEKIAKELKDTGSVRPAHYRKATVLFTDFEGFTYAAEKMKPAELLRDLDKCFSHFDSLMDKYNLEKLKTIGDSYMCVGGLPLRDNKNPENCVAAALEMLEYVNKQKLLKQKKGKDFWDIRIGIHTGSLVAGIIGTRKFTYDVWGDTVNTASRMESSGKAGKINISEATYKFVKDKFDCKNRGKVHAKNKGQLAMYFVESVKHKTKKKA